MRNKAGAAYQNWMRAQMAYDKANLDFADAIGKPMREADLLALAGKVGRLQDEERIARHAARVDWQLPTWRVRKAPTSWPTTRF